MTANPRLKPSVKAEHELVPTGESTSFIVREFKLPRFKSPWHIHSEYELTLIIKGSGKRFVGDTVMGFSSGDLVLIGSNLPHYWRSDQSPQKKAHSLVIQFKKSCLGEGFFEKPEMKQIKTLLLQCRRGIIFSGRTRRTIAARMLAIRKAAGIRRIQEFISILDILSKSGEARFLASEGFLKAAVGWRDERITMTCQHIFDHLSERIYLNDLARRVSMNPESFCRFFRKMTGNTLFSFINCTRIGRACALLIDSTMNISEVCYASGFNNLSNFNRRFRSLKGMSPSHFRNQYHLLGQSALKQMNH